MRLIQMQHGPFSRAARRRRLHVAEGGRKEFSTGHGPQTPTRPEGLRFHLGCAQVNMC